MDNENINQDTLRETIEKNYEALESQTIQDGTQDERAQALPSSDRPRDDRGRFAPKQEEAAPTEPEHEAKPEPEAIRPKGWKKDYLPAWEKLSRGEALAPDEAMAIAKYAVQRETEFASGVSTYKTAAQQAEELSRALEPIAGRLQQIGMKPSEYIGRLAEIDNRLTSGTPQQKIQMIGQLAQAYGIPLSAMASGQIDSPTNELLAQLQRQNEEISRIRAWQDSQENSAIQSQISAFASSGKAPHFDAVREQMGRLIEAGMASNLEEAYEAAVLLNPDTRISYLQTQQDTSSKIAAAERAKQAAVSVKTTTPKGKTSTQAVNANDLRAVIEASWASTME